MVDMTGDYYDDLALLYEAAIDPCCALLCIEAQRIETIMQQIASVVDNIDALTDAQRMKFVQGILHVYAHFYAHHYASFVNLQLGNILDMCTQHFLVFVIGR